MKKGLLRLNIGEYLADTLGLSTEEHGIYFLLMMVCWNRKCLPNNLETLARIAKLSKNENNWSTLQHVLDSYFNLGSDGNWHHRKMDVLRIQVARSAGLATARGKKGAEARWRGVTNGQV